MFTAQQYFEKATEYQGLLGSAHSPDEAIEFRELKRLPVIRKHTPNAASNSRTLAH
jgi:hypothetical protein